MFCLRFHEEVLNFWKLIFHWNNHVLILWSLAGFNFTLYLVFGPVIPFHPETYADFGMFYVTSFNFWRFHIWPSSAEINTNSRDFSCFETTSLFVPLPNSIFVPMFDHFFITKLILFKNCFLFASLVSTVSASVRCLTFSDYRSWSSWTCKISPLCTENRQPFAWLKFEVSPSTRSAIQNA